MAIDWDNPEQVAKYNEKKKELQELVKQAYAAVAKAQEFADQHDLEFGFSLAYGMGGHYYSAKTEERLEMENDGADYLDNGWSSSSRGC